MFKLNVKVLAIIIVYALLFGGCSSEGDDSSSGGGASSSGINIGGPDDSGGGDVDGGNDGGGDFGTLTFSLEGADLLPPDPFKAKEKGPTSLSWEDSDIEVVVVVTPHQNNPNAAASVSVQGPGGVEFLTGSQINGVTGLTIENEKVIFFDVLGTRDGGIAQLYINGELEIIP